MNLNIINSDKTASLKARSKSILSAFSKVAVDLATVNQQALKEEEAERQKSAEALAKASQLKNLQADNERVINNINRILGL